MKKIYDALSVAIDSIDRKYYEDAAELLPAEDLTGEYLNAEDFIEMKGEEKKINHIAKIVAVAAAFICVAAVSVFLIMNNNKVQVLDGLSSGSYESSTNSNENSTNMSENNFSTINSVKDDFEKITNSLKLQNFDNINFQDAVFSFPDVNEVYTLQYKITDYDITADDAYNYMCKRLDELFPESFDDEEKANEIRFFDVQQKFHEEEQRIEEYPTLEQYKAIKDKNYPYILTNHPTTGINHTSDKVKENYLDILNGVLWCYDNGILAKRSEFNRSLGSFDVLSQFPVVYRTENLECEKIFRLLNEEISIADAVKRAEKLLSEFEVSQRELPFKLCIQNVNVLDIGDNCHAFYFGIVPEYKGVKYNCIMPDNTAFGFSTIDDNTNEFEACGEFIMCETDTICRYKFLNPASMYDIFENDLATSIISLENAAEITSKYLTAGMKFDVLSVSAVYKSFSQIDDKQSTDYEDYERREITLRPCWRFVLQPLTGSTNRLYYIFVDMLTGEAFRTVQTV
ncbi:MAG: hypothetical protein IJZ51_03815 [Ruminiclostridium sp.]|nr:hypothetical protein [Ruminiclostridium sp.]